jgi:hypothetical protein
MQIVPAVTPDKPGDFRPTLMGALALSLCQSWEVKNYVKKLNNSFFYGVTSSYQNRRRTVSILLYGIANEDLSKVQ